MSRNLYKPDDSTEKGGNAAVQTHPTPNTRFISEATDAVKEGAFANQLMEYTSLLFSSNTVPDTLKNHVLYIVIASLPIRTFTTKLQGMKKHLKINIYCN